MNEKKLIDANIVNPEDVFAGSSDFAKDCRDGVERLLAAQPTIDPKTLPIVQQLQSEIDWWVCEVKKIDKSVQYWVNYAKDLEKQLAQALHDCVVAEQKRAECIEKIAETTAEKEAAVTKAADQELREMGYERMEDGENYRIYYDQENERVIRVWHGGFVQPYWKIGDEWKLCGLLPEELSAIYKLQQESVVK